MKAILSAPGSRGDVNPMVAIGVELQRLGYDCTISLAEPYEEVARKAGLKANVVIDSKQFESVVADPHFWKPFRGARTVLREVANRFLEPHLNCIAEHYVPGQTVMVAHPLDFASRVFREAHSESLLTSIHLAPASLRLPQAPPRLLSNRLIPQRPAAFMKLAYWMADRLLLDPCIAKPINAARLRLANLPPRQRFLHHWWLSPDQLLGFYPEWFAPEIATHYSSPIAGVASLECLGFPLDDGVATSRRVGSSTHCQEPLPTDRPVLLTTGSAHHGDSNWVQRVAKACGNLEVPLVWCCPSNPTLPSGLSGVRTVGYVPLGDWLPHCRLLIHHGGIGTTSRGLAANVPQLIRPLAFDQFDNAERVETLGRGLWLRRDRDVERCLRSLLNSEESVSEPLTTVNNAAKLAAEKIDTLARSRGFGT